MQFPYSHSITFGITAGFLYTYYYDQTVATYLGDQAVGIVSAFSPLVSSMLAIPLTNLSMSVGRNLVIFLGCVCVSHALIMPRNPSVYLITYPSPDRATYTRSLSFSLIAVLYLIWDDEQLGNWGTW